MTDEVFQRVCARGPNTGVRLTTRGVPPFGFADCLVDDCYNMTTLVENNDGQETIHVKIGHVKIDRAHFRVHFREHWKISREHSRGSLRGDSRGHFRGHLRVHSRVHFREHFRERVRGSNFVVRVPCACLK